MAMIENVQKAPVGAVSAHRAFSGVSGMARGMSAWVTARLEAAATARELSRLTPRMLADIGMSDADVARIREESRYL